MTRLIRKTACWFFVLFSAVSNGACSEPGKGVRGEGSNHQKMIEGIKGLDTSIEFFGRVLDQNDQPVIGAEVVVNVESFDPFSEFFVGVRPHQVETDFEGRFELTGCKGSGIFVDTISAEGYEFRYTENRKRSFAFKVEEGTINPPIFIPNKDEPVIFRLRKKLLGRTFLFQNRDWGLGVNRDGSGEDRGYDLVDQRRFCITEVAAKDKGDVVCDLRYMATFDEETELWTVVFSACNTDGGISVSEEELFVAPEKGYKDEFSFIAKDIDLPKEHFLYVKSRMPSIYSRVEITDIRVTEEHVRVYGNSVTNPYGDRVLDSVDMDSLSSKQRLKLKRRLKSEAQEALRQGRLPERPKIMVLIEAAKRGGE